MPRDSCYYYEFDVNVTQLFRKNFSSHYATELRQMFAQATNRPYDDCDQTITVTKEQFALFLYLRCKMGGDNGMRCLNMRRVQQPSCNSIDLTQSTEVNNMCKDEKKPGIVELASELEEVERYLAIAKEDRNPITLGVAHPLKLNSKHMVLVLKAQQAKLRKEINLMLR